MDSLVSVLKFGVASSPNLRALCLMSALLLSSGQVPDTLADETSSTPHWDVSQPDFSVEAQTVTLDTATGTWMNLDVSPDGRQLVFGLLGDIYTLPIEGGLASNITAGLQWDMQPRFSPDGKRIAYTSDRDGGDNIWIMNADGSEPRALSKESFRLLSDPAWSPDGRYIVARKHFTTQRSEGTGELWIYAVDGGDGLRVVERPNPRFQKELGEPVYSPDGRFIYFSQNVTPGDTFIYAQDSNGETFRIRRVSLEDGRVDDVTGGPGGAVTATPSPDGRWLAFVRRVRAVSRLFVRDLASGDERMIDDALDQDMQETWAINGVYPNMAWTPDSKALVYWARGRIWRVAIGDGEIREIPFRIRDARTVYPAAQAQFDAAPEQFRTRMLRWAQPFGSGGVLYESLGRLYVENSDRPARRLTRDDEQAFELFPTLSRDGRFVYFVRWQDQALGHIYRVSSQGGKPTRLTTTPGHYRELAISPDGQTVVVRRASGGKLLSPMYSDASGIYRMSATGGELTLITRDGEQPHFGASDARLFVVRQNGAAEEGGAAPQKLVRIEQNGGNPIDIANARFPILMQMAPDERHLLWLENYALRVIPYTDTGRMLELGEDFAGVSVRTLDPSTGVYAGWSADGRAVHWVKGNEWALKPVDEVDPPLTKILSGVQTSADRPAGLLTLNNARVVTMTDRGVIENGRIVIDANRIVAVGPDIPVPAGSRQIDLNGKTVIPGLIDFHAHGPYAEDSIVPQRNWSLLGHLALGVTTVHDPSSVAHEVFAAAEYRNAGRITGPRIWSTGEIIYGARAPRYAPIDSLDDALRHVHRLKVQGAISVKNYNQPRRDQRQQVVEAARREGVLVVAEGGAIYDMDMNLIADGNTAVEHTLAQQAIYDDVVQFWAGTRVASTHTLVVNYGAIAGEDYWYGQTEVWKHPILSRWVPPGLLQARSVRRMIAPLDDYGHEENAAIAKQLAEAGVAVHTGGHGQREGLATHWELWTMVQGGMSPAQALAAATIVPARSLGMSDDLGSVEAGKLADLVVIDGDPLSDIRHSDRVSLVISDGRVYDPLTMNEQLTGSRVNSPLYWHGRPEAEIR